MSKGNILQGYRGDLKVAAISVYSSFMLIGFGLPLIVLVWMSLKSYALGQPTDGLSLSNYQFLLAGEEFLDSLGRSAGLALVVAIVVELLGIGIVLGAFAAPYAIFREGIPLACAVMFFAGVIPRTVAFGYVLSGRGPLQSMWAALPGRDGLLYSGAGAVVGYLPLLLPLSVLALYVARQSVNQAYLAAAQDLGARWLTIQGRVVLPMMKPGLIVAFLLPFIMAFGDVVVVDLIGGSQVYTAGLVIVDFVKIDDWGLAAAAATSVLGVISLVLAAAGYWAIRSVEEWQGIAT